MSSHKAILRSSALYSGGMVFENLCSIVSSYFVARMLGPHIQGIWQTAKLFRYYSEFAGMGQALGMRREAAVAAGAGDDHEVELQRDTGFTWNSGSMLVAGAILATYAGNAAITPMLRLALFSVAVVVALSGVTSFFNLWFKTTERFGVLAAAAIVGGMGYLALVGLIFWHKFTGLITGYVLISAAVTATLAIAYKGRLHWRFSPSVFKRSMVVGFPLFLVSVAALIFATLDRILVISLMGFANMGFYSIATMSFMPIQMAVGSLSVVLMTRVCHRYGMDGSSENLNKYYELPLSVFMVGLPGVAGALALCVPVAVRLLLPAYEAGILPAQVMLFGLAFSSTSGFCHNVLLAAGRPWWIVVVSTASSAVKLILAWGLIHCGHGLVGVATATSLSYVIEFLLIYRVTVTQSDVSVPRNYRVVIESVIITASCIGISLYAGMDIAFLWAPDIPLGAKITRGLATLTMIGAPILLATRRGWMILKASQAT